MDWGIVPGREQEGQVAAPTVGVSTSYPPPNWGPSYPNVGSTEYDSNCSAAPSYATATPFDFSAPDSRGFNPVTTFENNSNSHHHYNTTSPPFSLSQTTGVRTPGDGFFSPPLSPPMPGGHVGWAPQSATGISERSLFPFQQQQQPHSAHDDGSGFTSMPASAAVAAQFSPRSSRSAASPYSSPTFTAGHCSAVSWTSSPPPPEDHHTANIVEMAKPVSRTETTKTTLKGAREKGVPATTKPAAGPSSAGKSLTKAGSKLSKGNYSRASKGTPMKASNAIPKKATKIVLKKEPSEEDDDDDEDDIPSGTTTPILTSALSPDKFPTLEAYKTYMRDWHNRIGRKYRNKLNKQFENLLAVLQLEEARRLGPKDPHRSLTGIVIQGSKKHTTIGRGPNAINKAKLLDIARQRVEEIADERDALLAERDQLLRRLQEVGA